MKRFLKILYVFVLIFLSVWVFTHPVKTETNILKAIVSDSELIDLSGLYSSKINVLVEGETQEQAINTAEEFDKRIDKTNLKSVSINPAEIFETYKSHRTGLLAQNDLKLLESSDFETIKQNSIEKIYNPFSLPLLSLEDDPFMLFSDYIYGLGDLEETISFNDKYYKVLNYEFSEKTSLSPSLLNKEVKKIINLQKDFPNVYLTGTPIHSYAASSRSITEINIICILSALFVIALCMYYFRTPVVLLAVCVSLFLGYLSGYLITGAVFGTIHVLTFVFAATLIGICADYSLHYFVSTKGILKSLTTSMLTTVCAFLILLFSGTVLLKQIALFTICGLISVYAFVTLFYPSILKPLNRKKCLFAFDANQKIKNIVLVFCALVILCGLFFIKYNDNIKNMYTPSKKLAYAEKLFADVTGIKSKTSFAAVSGKNIQECLEKEEQISKNLTDYQALSKYVPSVKQQNHNRELIQKLYKNTVLPYVSGFKLPPQTNLLPEDLPFSENFMFKENKTLMVLYDFDSPEIFKNIEGIKYYNLQNDISNIVKKCRQNCMKLFMPVFLLIFIILIAIYRVKNALILLLPSLLAYLFTLGLLSFFTHINLFHIIALFLVTGFSLDYSIFRFNGEKCANDAVFMSCATSVFSFTLLAMTGFKLISSLGFVLAVGLLTSYILSVLLIRKNSML